MYKLTAKFFFDNGQVKKVDWLEKELNKRAVIDGKETEVPLTLEEVELEFRKLFLKYMKQGEVMTIPNIQGELSVVPFAKVHYITLKIEVYNDKDETE